MGAGGGRVLEGLSPELLGKVEPLGASVDSGGVELGGACCLVTSVE